jgi:WD40 repeat protein
MKPYAANVFDTTALKPVATLSPESTGESLMAVGFGRDATTLYTTSGIITAWDVAKGKERGRMQYAVRKGRNNARISPDGRYMVVETDESAKATSVGLVDLSTGKMTMAPYPRKRGFHIYESWKFANGGRRLYGSDQMGHLLLAWSVPDGKLIGEQEFPNMAFFDISEDGRRIAVFEKGPPIPKSLPVYETATKKLIARLDLEDSELVDWAISPNGRYVAASNLKAHCLLWDLDSDKPKPTVKGAAQPKAAK